MRTITIKIRPAKRLVVGDVFATDHGGRCRVLNPDWPRGTEPFCEPADADEPITHPHPSDTP